MLSDARLGLLSQLVSVDARNDTHNSCAIHLHLLPVRCHACASAILNPPSFHSQG